MTPSLVSTLGTVVPYITVDELKRSPISTQLQHLVPNSSPADRDAELGRIIQRVSAMINSECNQNLAATVDTEVGWIVVSDEGDLRIHCRSNPIIEVLSVSIGHSPYSLTAISDLSHVVLDPWRITIPGGAGQLFGNNFSLGSFGRPGARLWAQWVYVNGYPVTTLADPVSAGDTTIIVTNGTGVLTGQTMLTVEDGIYLENIVPTAVNGNEITVAPLMFSHQPGVGVTALPDDVEETMLLLISRLHDSWSLSMGAITHDGSGAHKPDAGPARALCDAGVLLAPYRRRW